MAVEVRTWSPGMAHRMHRDVDALPRKADRHPRWRARPRVQPSRVGTGAIGIAHRQEAVRASLDAHGAGALRGPQDEQISRQPGEGQPGVAARAGRGGEALSDLTSLWARLELQLAGAGACVEVHRANAKVSRRRRAINETKDPARSHSDGRVQCGA